MYVLWLVSNNNTYNKQLEMFFLIKNLLDSCCGLSWCLWDKDTAVVTNDNHLSNIYQS